MADPFIQRMKARTHARRDILGVSGEAEKENTANFLESSWLSSSSGITPSGSRQIRNRATDLDKLGGQQRSTKYESKEATRISSMATLPPSQSLSSTLLSPNKASDSILQASSNNSSSRNRFQHLTNRSKQMQEWEDDYSYHSVCGGSVKEVENGLGLHDASTLSPVLEDLEHDASDIAINKEILALNCDKSKPSTYYYGEFYTPDKHVASEDCTDCSVQKCAMPEQFEASKNFSVSPIKKIASTTQTNYPTSESVIDSSFHSAKSNFSPHFNSPCVKTNYISHSIFGTPNTSTPEAVSSSVSATPTRRLAWDRQLLKSLVERSYSFQSNLEAQGFTPSPSKSKLGYDFRDRSPIKESNFSSKFIPKTSSGSMETSRSMLPKNMPEPPKIVSVRSKENLTCSPSSSKEELPYSPKMRKVDNLLVSRLRLFELGERNVSPSGVSGLRDQWEEHIRNSSPERQSQRSRSPSPERKYNHGYSRERSPVKYSERDRSVSPSKSYPTMPKKHEIADVPAIQGFNRGSGSRISIRSTSPQKPVALGEIIKGNVVMPETTPVVDNPSASVRERAAAFSSLAGRRAPEKDPAELSLKDRLNLFEKRNGPALVPKAPFGQCISSDKGNAKNLNCVSKSANSKPSSEANRENRKIGEEKCYQNRKSSQTVNVKETAPVPSLVVAQKKHFEGFEDNWKETDINAKVMSERQHEMNVLQNRFRRAPNVSPEKSEIFKPESSDSEYPESDESTAEEVYTSRGALGPPKPPRTFTESPPKEFVRPLPPSTSKSPSKRLNSTELNESYPRSPRKEYVPKVKPGCLFPSLSDIETQSEAVDSSEDDDLKNSSFAESILTCASAESLGYKIQKMAQESSCPQTSSQPLPVIEESRSLTKSHQSMSSSTLDALEAIDEALDEAFDDEPTPPKRGRNDEEDDSSNSVYKTPKIYQSFMNSKASADNPLMHTVSMYRKQKPVEVTVTPVRQIMRKPDLSSPSKDSPISPSVTISTRIRALQEEEEHQLTVISQASSALNVVSQHLEQHGTMQHVEAEKLLLVATQKRQSAVHEIQRLKAEGALGKRNCWSHDDDSCRGSISINNITLPLKADFLNKLNEKSFYHFVVLVKHRDQVITSELQATPDCIVEGAVTFPNLMALYNLTADFNISLEVYAFKVEPLSSAGIKKDHSRMKLTPLKRLQKESKSFSPSVSSPGGPYSIRSSSFTLIGFANLNINTLTRNAWMLEKVPFSSPVNGHLLMRVSVSMEGGVKESSFLTMFDDVGGFGAWNRRWCVLGGPFIKYWSYPEDEFNKESIGKMDLRKCTTRKVELVAREICARQHTFQLTLMRPLQAGDKADLVHEIKDNVLISRILLSADSREERILWCNKLNRALANIRSWDPDSLKPDDFQV